MCNLLGNIYELPMKRLVICLLLSGMFLMTIQVVWGQEMPQKEALIQAEQAEEETPLILKFEPQFAAAEAERREEIEMKKALIDSLDISESRRQKLIRDLYKSEGSRRLNKILLANTRFEEDPDQ